ncbi:PGR5-like protein 1A, chloroplastic isoform X2 [Carya illinoinensis]|uniref:PGR5-like protein 1A, chloroplastic isoform X2 n=1 Tax=Carya illinoinensis TaxID=32201 RepID=UPI001C71806C|nr:PGR5-like protein 1A, chloroplastic isoform X2 [Carya illinoinensis]
MATELAITLSSPRLHPPPVRRPLSPISSSVSSLSSSTRFQSVVFNRRHICFRRRCLVLPTKATADQQDQVEGAQGGEVVDGKILPDGSIDKKEKKSVGELEQDFLQALQAFYYEGKAIMSNEEFDNLKEELMWEGSSVVMLSSDEQKFLEASMAYVAGKPILNDEEFDQLKLRLKTEGSEIVVEGPRCSLRSRKVYSDLSVDYLKMLLLNVPATVVALGLFFFLDDITGFEITYLLEHFTGFFLAVYRTADTWGLWNDELQLPEPFSFIFTWFAAVPLIVWLALSLTNAIVKDFLILKGACPNCGTENGSFFGTILSISSGGSTNTIKCSNCETALVYDSKTRLITLPEGSNA